MLSSGDPGESSEGHGGVGDLVASVPAIWSGDIKKKKKKRLGHLSGLAGQASALG